MILGMTGAEVTTLGDLQPVLEHARALLHPVPADRRWTPYLGETLDSGMATLLAEEVIEALRFVYGRAARADPRLPPGRRHRLHQPSTEATATATATSTARSTTSSCAPGASSWSTAACPASPPSSAAPSRNEVAVKIVRELQQRNILIFLCGNVNGRSIIHQLQEEGVEMGYDTYIVPFGPDTISAIYAAGLRHPLGADLRRHEGRPGPRHPALQQEPRLRLRAGAGRGRRPEVRHGRRRDQLRLPGHRRHDHPRDPAHRRHHLRARHLDALQRDRGQGRPGARREAGAEVHRGARRQGQASPRSPSRCPTARPSRARSCARTTCASSSAARRAAPSSTCAWRDLDQVEDGKIEVIGPTFDDVEPQARHGPGHPGRGGRAQDAEGLRAGARAPDPLLRQRRLRHPAHRPARHHLDPHQQGRRREGLQPEALRRDPARPLPRRLRQHRRQGAGDDHHRPQAARRVAGQGPRRPTTTATCAWPT